MLFRIYYAKAIELHQNVLSKTTDKIELLCAYAGIAKAQVYASSDAVSAPNSSVILAESRAESLDVDSIVSLLVSSYVDTKGVGRDVFQIGEEYYFLGEKLVKDGKKEKGWDAFQRAIDIWRNNTDQIEDSRHRCLAFYYSAVAYQNTGEMDKAVQFYNTVVTQWPDYEKAWDAQFMIVRICRDLRREGKLAKAQADPIIRSGCVNVLQRYPQCPVAGIAQRWLQEETKTQR